MTAFSVSCPRSPALGTRYLFNSLWQSIIYYPLRRAEAPLPSPIHRQARSLPCNYAVDIEIKISHKCLKNIYSLCPVIVRGSRDTSITQSLSLSRVLSRPLLPPPTAFPPHCFGACNNNENIYHEKIYYAYNKNISPGSSVRQPVSQRNVWARVRAEMRVLQRRGLWPRVGHVPLSTWLHGRQGEYCIS